ncbi:MAG: orotidine-5'-phosphate decarboxylase [Coriobacteriia bacterium]|nr:orotidine-5'-phosphate decarboxylase [Coriobacteriia bacterium]
MTPDTKDGLHSRCIVALDLPRQESLEIASSLKGIASWVKVGLTLFFLEGPSIVYSLKEMGFKVFADLKLFDIPHQIEGAARSLVTIGVDMFTLYALGGLSMMQAARAGADEASQSRPGQAPKILAVTVLTSMDQEVLQQTGISNGLDDQVKTLASLAVEAGMDGLVSSPLEIRMLRSQVPKDKLIVTPGIRPLGSENNDQSRTATPKTAIDEGADFIVVGRPITAALDPAQAFISLFD